MRIKRLTGIALVAVIVFAAPALADKRRAEPPANDDAAEATVVAEVPFATTFDDSGSTLEKGERQPSCAAPAGSAWFVFTPSQSLNLIASASSEHEVNIAAFRADWTEAACGAGTAPKIKLSAAKGETLLIQVSRIGHRGGNVAFELEVDPWQERTLHDQTYSVSTISVEEPLVTVDGRPSADDKSYYEVRVTVGDQKIAPIGVLTMGTLQREVKAELLKLAAQEATVDVELTYRYDTTQAKCLAYTGEGDDKKCAANSPLSDPASFGSNGSEASLVITIDAIVDTSTGKVTERRSISVPFAGQAMGLLP